MRTTRFATVLAVIATCVAAPAFARDDGPRFASDRLDSLVAQHAEANRHIATHSSRTDSRTPTVEAQSPSH